VTIPPEGRDLELPEKLKAEAPGILQWQIDGCLAWQQTGLQPPAAVTEATKEYLDAQDLVSLWLAECCLLDKQAEESSTTLFASFKTYAEAAGERPGSQRAFSDLLEGKGFRKRRTMNGRLFDGLRVVAAPSGSGWRAA
jgi:putative DNA primase/helicase